MSLLSTLPPHTVREIGDVPVAALEREVRAAGQRWLHADCGGTRDKAGVLAALARDFGLPAWFGGNLDALYDCVTDLELTAGPGRPGIVIVIEHLPSGPGFGPRAQQALLSVFRDAAAAFAAQDIGFRVLYSVSCAGPAAP
jgi:RNAse (barnase) inhibitor barstar